MPPRSVEWRTRYGPWALVTGASRGIGFAFASRLAARGLDLILVARDASQLSQAAAGLEARYAIRTLAISADLAEPEGRELVLAGTAEVDAGLVVLNAGDGCEGEFSEHSLEDEQRIVSLNVLSTLELTHTFARRLTTRGRGGLVIVSSLLAYQGAPYAANYAATKAYGLVLAESLHFELRPRGVDVLAVVPGPTKTETGRVEAMRFPASQWCTADHVVDSALGALGRRASVVPGAVNNLLLWGGLVGREATSHMVGRIARDIASSDSLPSRRRRPLK